MITTIKHWLYAWWIAVGSATVVALSNDTQHWLDTVVTNPGYILLINGVFAIVTQRVKAYENSKKGENVG